MLFCSMPEILNTDKDTAQRTERQMKVFSELIGHTPLQVLMGTALGLAIGLSIPLF
jgi:acid phosphatase family membrane protein YuiD